jgi:glycosyltransferase involved in cell wall biosynthesis
VQKIVLIPVFNEDRTLVSVIDSLHARVDGLVIVDDGSVDRSLALAREWAAGKAGVAVLRLPENRGMAAALREGFLYLAARLREGTLQADDLIVTLDADGQHNADEVEALCSHVERLDIDVALARRDFSLYPAYKRLGNLLLTLWGRIWSGHPYSDVESGFRAMRLKVLSPLMEFYRGRRYSCAQEIAVLTARLGFRVDNTFVTVIRHYRSRTRMRDVAINAAAGFCAFARWYLGRKVRIQTPLAELCTTPERP